MIEYPSPPEIMSQTCTNRDVTGSEGNTRETKPTALLALALVLASSSPSSAAKLTVTEPPGYVIRTRLSPSPRRRTKRASAGDSSRLLRLISDSSRLLPFLLLCLLLLLLGLLLLLQAPLLLLGPSVAAPAPLYQGLAAGSAGVRGQQALQGAASQGPQVPAQYDFGYAVSADDAVGNRLDYGHQEERNGAQTAGSYFVRLPDTRMMRVEYTVDEFGFHPIVTFEGEAVYPDVASPVGSPVGSPIGSPSARRPDQLYAAPSRK
ncbi:uncharacterized protein LOC122266499 [Penaeus japonicus]|uniref:uncharacterized protein LOC122266499 n=1 Tax=Penaeus japonicus TaxID=27405 RepID=UPI001C70EB86|nr:uncharacterized protein LOC122266499 [Penaeus japonicus]